MARPVLKRKREREMWALLQEANSVMLAMLTVAEELVRYSRWFEAMELWQIDVMGGVMLADGTECKAITGIDYHSRFCVIAKLVHPDHAPAGATVTQSGPTGRDEDWFWSPLEKIQVWWSSEPIGVPGETGGKRLLASLDPGSSCDFTITFATPDVAPGRHVITILGYHQGEGFGWMGERRFTVVE